MTVRIVPGDSYVLGQDKDGGEICVMAQKSIGFGELYEVIRESDGAHGMIFFQANGHWWWVRNPDDCEDDNEPWKR